MLQISLKEKKLGNHKRTKKKIQNANSYQPKGLTCIKILVSENTFKQYKFKLLKILALFKQKLNMETCLK